MNFKTVVQNTLIAVVLVLTLGTFGVIAGLKLADEKE